MIVQVDYALVGDNHQIVAAGDLWETWKQSPGIFRPCRQHSEFKPGILLQHPVLQPPAEFAAFVVKQVERLHGVLMNSGDRAVAEPAGMRRERPEAWRATCPDAVCARRAAG